VRNAALELADILMSAGVATDGVLEPVLADHYREGVPFGQTLVERGIVTPEHLAQALARQMGVEYIDLDSFVVDRAAAEKVGAAICRRHVLLPVAIRDGRLVVAMADPADLLALDDVRLASGMSAYAAVAPRDRILQAIDKYTGQESELEDLATAAAPTELPDLSTLTEVTDDSPIVKYVNSMLTRAVGDGASDVHIEPGERGVRVRYRVDGVLHEIADLPKNLQSALISRVKVMSDIDIAERRRPQDGRLTLPVSGRAVDLRVATLPTVWGEKIVLRVLDNTGVKRDLDGMDFAPDTLAKFGHAISKPHGLVLVTGPTGSGKTTTLYAALNKINSPTINVITVEDPVEYRLAGINQIQVNRKASLTFASALRAILRADPDVVLLGEIRDGETAQIAVESALTGHLVLSTMHTNDAPSAVTRLSEIGIEPFLVGSSVSCVLAQRLLRRLCDHCKAPYEPTAIDRAAAESAGLEIETDGVLYRPVGCAYCAHIGFRGRMAVHEVMPMSEPIERLTIAGASASALGATAREEGMRTLRADALIKALAGHTSVDEVIRVVA
jgi:type IV pilus assembly protein PilB